MPRWLSHARLKKDLFSLGDAMNGLHRLEAAVPAAETCNRTISHATVSLRFHLVVGGVGTG